MRFEASAPDGAQLFAADQGDGPVILVLHGGLDDGSTWAKVAARLSDAYRVIRIHRRTYRLDLEPAGVPAEVADVEALVAALGAGPVLLVGHSSGAVLALEAALANPGAFSGLVLYEPPVVVNGTLGGAATGAAEAAVERGKPGEALQIFLREVVQVPVWQARLVGLVALVWPKLKAYVPRQVADLRAIDDLGNRLDAYRAIELQTVLLGGSTSPAHLGARLDALEQVLPRAERITLPGQGHGANASAPAQVAAVIRTFQHKLRA